VDAAQPCALGVSTRIAVGAPWELGATWSSAVSLPRWSSSISPRPSSGNQVVGRLFFVCPVRAGNGSSIGLSRSRGDDERHR